MKFTLLILCIVCLTVCQTYAQVKIEGRVLDKNTLLPISAVSVLNTEKAIATVTNANGEFVLFVERLPAKLKFSHISYHINEETVDTSQLNVLLAPLSINLSTVTVTAQNASTLMNKAWDLAEETKGLYYFGKGFYRQITTINNSPTEVHELFYDLKWSTDRINGWQAQQSRYARVDDFKDVVVSNQSYLTFLFSGYLFDFDNAKYPTSKSLKRDYTAKISKYIERDGQDIAVISCKLNEDKRMPSTVFVDVVYYVGTENYKIYRVESTVYNIPYMDSGSKGTLTSIANFVDKSFPVPVLANLETQLNIPFKKNNDIFNIKVQSRIAVYLDAPEIIDNYFRTTSEFVIDRNVIKSTAYNPKFWADNPVVKRTPLENEIISELENRSAFGTMLAKLKVVSDNLKSAYFFEKTYLHTDRELYSVGDDIWFKAYLADAKTNRLTNSSNNLYVELINSRLDILDRKLVRMDNGLGKGDFHLEDSLPSGLYKIRAYTNWMQNFGNSFIFEKDIQILSNRQLNKASKPTLSQNSGNSTQEANKSLSPTVRFFAEGGSLIEENPALVAFKAESPNGMPIGIKGIIMTSEGDKVSEYSSVNGIGTFSFTPHAKTKYVMTGVTNNGEKFIQELPVPLLKGISMSVSRKGSMYIVTVNSNPLSLKEMKNRLVELVVKSKGKVVLSNHIEISDLRTSMIFSKDSIPAGISCITLFNPAGKAECERLIYNERSGNTVLSISTDKIQDAQKEMVQLTIIATDEQKRPVKANLSLSVVDAMDISKNKIDILSYLDLKSEIKGWIADPGLYFDKSNPDRYQQLDLLLLTQGWREYIWRRLADSALRISHNFEKGILVSGMVYSSMQPNNIIHGANVTLFAPKMPGNHLFADTTDSSGKYYFNGLNFYGRQPISLSSRNSKGEPYGTIAVNTFSAQPMPVMQPFKPYEADRSESVESKIKVIQNRASKLSDTIKLKDVAVGAPKFIKLFDSTVQTFGYKDEVYVVSPKDYDHKNLRHYLQHYSSALFDNNGMIYFSGPNSSTNPESKYVYPRLIVNNIELPFNETPDDRPIRESYYDRYLNMPINQFEKIIIKHVLGTPDKTTTENADGQSFAANQIKDFYLIYLVVDENGFPTDGSGTLKTDINGYYQAREFFISNNPIIDAYAGKTVLWIPDITTNDMGQATVKYSNPYPNLKTRITVEGLTEQGIPVVSTVNPPVK